MNEIKNILYVGGFEMPDKNAAAQRVINNGKILAELNYKVFFNGINKTITTDEQAFDDFKIGSFHFPSRALKYPNSIINWFNYITGIKKVKQIIENELKKEVSIVIAYNYPALKLWRLSRYCRKRNIRLIADVTEWYQPEGSFFIKHIKKLDNILRMKYVHFKMDGIITISNFLTNFYKRKHCIKLPPLVDKCDIKWKNDKLNLQNISRVLTYVGSPGAGRKDRLDLIIKSLSKLKKDIPSFTLKIIGISAEEYKDSFPNQIIPENIKENIFFYGRLGHESAIEHLKSSDFSIFLRNNNLVNTAGFPTKFVESITLGIPVLTNLTSDLNDYFTEGKSGFILDTSTNENLVRSIESAILIPYDQIVAMKQYCLSIDTFHYQKYSNTVAQFIQRILN